MSVAVPGTCVHTAGAVGLMQNVQQQLGGWFAHSELKNEAARWTAPNPFPLSKQNVLSPKALEQAPRLSCTKTHEPKQNVDSPKPREPGPSTTLYYRDSNPIPRPSTTVYYSNPIPGVGPQTPVLLCIRQKPDSKARLGCGSRASTTVCYSNPIPRVGPPTTGALASRPAYYCVLQKPNLRSPSGPPPTSSARKQPVCCFYITLHNVPMESSSWISLWRFILG